MQNTKNIDICYITGDGIGQDITPASQMIGNEAFKSVYGPDAKINWIKLYAGQEALKALGNGLPQETLDAIAEYGFGIKGPMTTEKGGGNRSFNVALRKELDLYACVRPLKYYDGVPTSHIAPRDTNAVLFRENIEDVYSGSEFKANSDEARQLIELVNKLNPKAKIDISSAIGIKHISATNSLRIIKAAADYATKYNFKNISVMHKGNIMKFTEGYFMKLAYQLIKEQYPEFITQRELWILQNHQKGRPLDEIARADDREHYDFLSVEDQEKAQKEVLEIINSLFHTDWEQKKVINDKIADDMLQQTFIRPQQFGIITATNLNGDYESDAFAGVIGGLGVAPGANINFETGVMVAEATHGTASDLPRNVANASSHLLSLMLGFRLKGHQEVADRIEQAFAAQIKSGRVTGDLVNIANGIYTRIEAQMKKDKDTPGLEILLKYAEVRKNAFTKLSTTQFAAEIAQRIADGTTSK